MTILMCACKAVCDQSQAAQPEPNPVFLALFILCMVYFIMCLVLSD